MHSPETLVVASRIQIPNMKTFGQSQPSDEILGVGHLYVEDTGLAGLRRKIIFVTW